MSLLPVIINKMPGLEKIMIFFKKIKKIGFFLFKSDFFDLNRIFLIFFWIHIRLFHSYSMQQVIQGGDNVYKQILCDVINYRYNIVFKILN